MRKTILSLFAASAFLMLNACGSSESKEESAKEPLYNAELGVQMYTFRNQMRDSTWTVEAVLDTAKALGFTEIEGGASRGLSPEEFKALCDARGMKVVSAGSSFEQLGEDPQPIIDNAKALGAEYVMCAWIPHDGNNFTFEDAENAVKVFNAAGKKIADAGLIFCYHPHGYEFRPNPNGEGTLLDYIISNTDPESVSFEMDVLWTMHGGGDPVALLKKYGDRYKLMHVKDLKKGVQGDFTGGTPAENDVPVGMGQADWPAIFTEAQKIGMTHFFVEDESDKEFENIPQSIEYIKSLTK
ncbi:sugar phosphate isomerase/epimerase [Marinilongibacter aquaticus]|uniref:sugar phosphate isomerase/epimerase family protein n=1 Tax=Marinilongibacter aquaticus TaxID=2975157 RepID=UPI0021BD3402|nr:sugar phosphate isomerase/epimerase [Marinilongibacter aquaticus]UBM57394.1 sugar phosphate isomerase/epimerase [Marinilongibacter aquaticus]